MDPRSSLPRCGTPGSAGRLLRAALVCSVIGAGAVVQAGESFSSLNSAFRPQTLPAASTTAPGVNTAGPGAALPTTAATATGGGLPGLRIVVSGKSRAVATIDGQLVRVGDVVNGMRVMQIDDQGVNLKGAGGAMERLLLNPGVAKRPRTAESPATAQGARR